MTAGRLEAARRLVRVQGELRRAAETKLARLEAEARGIEARQSELLASLDPENPLHGLFLDAMARRLRSLVDALDAARRAVAAQEAALVRTARLAAAAERLLAEREAETRLAAERTALAEVIDRHVATAAASASLP